MTETLRKVMRLIEFTSPDCGACKAMEGFIAGACEEFGIEFVPRDVTVWPQLARAYGISVLPTLILTNEEDVPVARVSGSMSKARFIRWLTEKI